jgi:hypothetical protein
MVDAISNIIALADEYGRVEGIESSTVSWRVFGDTKKLDALRNGADLQTRRYAKALDWFAANWPVGAIWPTDIPRQTEAA